MLPTSSGPSLSKGAFVVTPPTGGTPVTVIFQYNPASVSRSLKARTVGGEADGHSEVVRFTGAPLETYAMDVEIDALDQMTPSELSIAARNGILPQLCALETLIYPPLQQVTQSMAQLAQGVLEVAPFVAPLTLLVWGSNRTVPVQLTEFSVTEQAFDADLNPVRATVSLTARVLSYSEMAPGTPAYAQFLAYQGAKEAMARMGLSRNTNPNAAPN